jgi:hypothetical protein
MSESASETTLFPITFQYHYNTYAGTLYDVEGNVLVGDGGQRLNVFQVELKEKLITKAIRFIHCMSSDPTYAYFIQSDEQQSRFLYDRVHGHENPNMTYHVYPDPN